MKNFFSALLFCLITLTGFAMQGHAQQEGIVVIVNDGAITQSDVVNRLRLIMASSGLPMTQEMADRMRPQIISSLIDEELMLQEARRVGADATEEDIQSGFAKIAEQNQKKPEEFQEMLNKAGMNINTLYRQIAAQIAWSKFVQADIRPKIIVSEADIDEGMEAAQKNIGKSEYLLAEIFLPIEEPQEETNTLNLAEKLIDEIRSGKAPFSKVAQQFSKAAGAASGGDLGWVQEGQLSEELDTALPLIEKGTISSPIRSKTGYHILLMRDIRATLAENMPSRDDVMKNIGLQRLERMASRHLKDVKSNAFIENRDPE